MLILRLLNEDHVFIVTGRTLTYSAVYSNATISSPNFHLCRLLCECNSSPGCSCCMSIWGARVNRCRYNDMLDIVYSDRKVQCETATS